MQDLISVFATPEAMIAVFTLALLEIVLGIDNLVFIAILTGRLPKEQQKAARQFGLAMALIARIMLLFSLAWIARLETPLTTIEFINVNGHPLEITAKTLVLLGGGLFLIYKAVTEIYHKVELKDEEMHVSGKTYSRASILVNIVLMDVIFSLDSVITAVGMVEEVPLMIAGVVIAMIVMVVFADPISNFINAHASLKILALAFLLMIGTLLTAESFEFSVPKGFVYFAMFFSLGVEFVQMRYNANVQRRAAVPQD